MDSAPALLPATMGLTYRTYLLPEYSVKIA